MVEHAFADAVGGTFDVEHVERTTLAAPCRRVIENYFAAPMARTLRILQICHKPPRPSVDGGCLAMDSLTRGLLDMGHRVKVVSIHTDKHPFLPDQIEADLEQTHSKSPTPTQS